MARGLRAVALPPLLRGEIILRRAGRTAHRDTLRLDDLLRLGMPVLVALDAAAGVALAVQGVDVTLLLRRPGVLFLPAPASEHGPGVPGWSLH